MKTLTLRQGSPEWLAHRRTTRNASDAPVMMGAYPGIHRNELIRLMANGLEREHSDYVQKFILDKGHVVETPMRALAEKIIGEDLYPVTGVRDDGYLGASFDGITLDEGVIFEAKQHSNEKRKYIANQIIPPADYWQVVQQFAVCDSATRCLYLCGDGTETNTAQLWIDREQIEADIPKLLAGWAQFDADVAAYVPEETKAVPVAATVVGFGALSLHVEGRILASNLDDFKAGAEDFIARLPKPADLQTDQDFVDAKAAVKACEDAESRIKAAKDAAQAQMADVDAAFRLADTVAQTIRSARLALDKVVKVEEEARKASIVQAAVESVRQKYASINASMGEHALREPSTLTAVIGAAIKGKRTLASIKEAADTAAAQAKIDASQVADRTRGCIAVLGEFEDHSHLFADRVQLCAVKDPDDLRNLARARVAEHQQREAERLEAERERIRQEEAERIERERAQQETSSTPPTDVKPCVPNAGESIPIRPDANGRADGLPSVGGTQSRPGARIKLGDINAAIAPLNVSSDGLAQLGFQPVGTERSSKLYLASEFPLICGALARVAAEAPARLALPKAA